MKSTFSMAAFVLTALFMLFGASAFSQVESADNIKPASVAFDPRSAKISIAAMGPLAVLAAQMNANPSFKVVVTSNSGGSKFAQQLGWDRTNAVIEFMSEKNNIDRNRFIFQYEGQTSGPDNVDYRPANPGEEGPSNVAAPHPDLRR